MTSAYDVGMGILVAAAVPHETQFLPDSIPVVITGLGKTNAAMNLTRALMGFSQKQRRELEVINIGTCGALQPGLRGVFEPGVVINHEMNGDAIRALGYDPVERRTVPGGDLDVVLATGDVFVADTTLRDQLAQRAMLVDMEGFAIAVVCEEFGVPYRLVKHVSDDADDTAHQWNTSVHMSARDLASWWAENVTNNVTN